MNRETLVIAALALIAAVSGLVSIGAWVLLGRERRARKAAERRRAEQERLWAGAYSAMPEGEPTSGTPGSSPGGEAPPP